MVAYFGCARGHDCRLQRPVALYSLRQKFWFLVVLSLKAQNWLLRIDHTISCESDIVADPDNAREDYRGKRTAEGSNGRMINVVVGFLLQKFLKQLFFGMHQSGPGENSWHSRIVGYHESRRQRTTDRVMSCLIDHSHPAPAPPRPLLYVPMHSIALH